jgi:hypothetical protein
MASTSDIFKAKFLQRQAAFLAKYNRLFGKVADDVAALKNNPQARFVKAFDFNKAKPIQVGLGNLIVDFRAKSFDLIRDAQMASAGVSFLKNNALTGKYIDTIGKLGKDFEATGIIPNINSVMGFVARERPAETLSDAVWQIGDQLRAEMEIQLGIGIMNGDSPAVISRRIRKYLNNPTALFRKVRGKDGKLVPGIKEKMYHPGRGVYKSAYKNAMRLTRTETTQAYLLADHYRWLNTPYVLGVKIFLSGAHPDYPFPEICEVLAGNYPKWFIWVGWHPHCLCNAVPIMIPRDDFRAMLRGEKPMGGQMIDQMPEQFTKWVEFNRARIERAKSPPYFILDNYKDGQIANGLIRPGIPKAVIPSPAPKVAMSMADITKQKMNEATTVQEVNSAAETLLGVDHFTHKVTNLDILKTTYNRLYELMNEFKVLRISSIGDEKRKNVWASANWGSFNMAAKYFNDPKGFAESLVRSVKTKFHPIGCNTIRSVIDHEFGHILTTYPLFASKFSPGTLAAIKPEAVAFPGEIRLLERKYKLELTGIVKKINKVIARETPIIDEGWDGEYEYSALKPSTKLAWYRKQWLKHGNNLLANEVNGSILSATAKSEILELIRQFEATKLSVYSMENIDEFIAEGFTSAINNPGGNVYATEIMRLIKKMQGI